jgi:hypothetical protein
MMATKRGTCDGNGKGRKTGGRGKGPCGAGGGRGKPGGKGRGPR